MTDRAVFLDKDGTLVEDVPIGVDDPAKLRLLPGAAKGLALLREAGFRLFVVSNQQEVALGRLREDALTPIVRRLEELLSEGGAGFEGFYYCPHHPDGLVPEYAVKCRCRKPEPGLIEDACREQGLDPLRSWMIGDILDDVEAGRRAGCRTVMIDNGHETVWRGGPHRQPHLKAPDLAKAAEFILASEGPPG